MEKRYAKIAFSFVAGSAMFGVALIGSHAATTNGGLSAAYAAALDTVQWDITSETSLPSDQPVLDVARLDAETDPTAPTVVYRTIPEANTGDILENGGAEPSVAYRVTSEPPKLRPTNGVVPTPAPVQVAEARIAKPSLAANPTIVRDGFVETRISENRVIIRPVTQTSRSPKKPAIIAELQKEQKSKLNAPSYQIGVFW